MKKLIFLSIIIMAVIFGLSYQVTHALFLDNAISANNSFTAAAAFPTPTSSITPTEVPVSTPTPTPANIATNVVISEVQIDEGSGAANDHDFIELYNPTSSTISLNGMRLVVRTQNDSSDGNIILFGASDSIPAHGFYLWGHNSTDNNFAASISANVASSAVLSTNNSIALRNGALNLGSIIDSVGWGTPGTNSLVESSAFSPSPGDFQSIERKARTTSTLADMQSGGVDEFHGNGVDTNNNANDFVLRTVSQPQNSASPAEL